MLSMCPLATEYIFLEICNQSLKLRFGQGIFGVLERRTCLIRNLLV